MMTSNARHVESRGPAVLAVTTSMIACSTIFVVFRLISRIGIVQRVTWDDYFMIMAWLVAFGLSFSLCYGTSVGLGRHQEDIPDSWKPALQKSEYTFSVLYNPALMLTKTSILIFYLSLSQSQKAFRWATISTLAVVNVAGLALTLLNIIQCRPLSAAFRTPVPSSAHCTDLLTLYLSSAPANIITDLAIFFLPMPILTRMRLPMKQKIILIITFAFGVFVIVVDVVRIAYLQSAAMNRLERVQSQSKDSQNPRSTLESTDFSWYAGLSFMWSTIEVNVGIMCACVPALKPLVSRFLPHIIRNSSDVEHSLNYGPGTGGMSEMAQTHHRASLSAPLKKPDPTIRRDSGDPVDMVNFLTTPNGNQSPETCLESRLETQTVATDAGTIQSTARPTFFDFVSMKQRKSIVDMTNRESYYPVIMVTVLFFIWGSAYGLLDVLNAQFQAISHMSMKQSISLHSAYFVGYFIGPLTFGHLVFKHWGFKACYTVGLVIYACGTLVFWPSAVLTSFSAFLISNFIVGLGLSTLEISANPFIALCGPPEYAEVRLNLSQGLQAVGTVVSPLLAKKVLFHVEAGSLIDVQWTYLGISFFTIILAVGYYYVPLPEATEEELETMPSRVAALASNDFHGIPVVYLTLVLGLLSQFFYVGGQEAVSTSFTTYVEDAGFSKLNSTSLQAVGHTAFAVSRFLAAFVSIFIEPRYILLVSYTGVIIFSAACMHAKGNASAGLVIMVYFFEGPIFALLYSMCIRGLGRRTKVASALMTAAIGGGSVFPPLQHVVSLSHRAQYSYCVIVAAFAAGALFPVYLMGYPPAGKLTTPIKRPKDTEPRPPSSAEEHGPSDLMHGGTPTMQLDNNETRSGSGLGTVEPVDSVIPGPSEVKDFSEST